MLSRCFLHLISYFHLFGHNLTLRSPFRVPFLPTCYLSPPGDIYVSHMSAISPNFVPTLKPSFSLFRFLRTFITSSFFGLFSIRLLSRVINGIPEVSPRLESSSRPRNSFRPFKPWIFLVFAHDMCTSRPILVKSAHVCYRHMCSIIHVSSNASRASFRTPAHPRLIIPATFPRFSCNPR